MVTIPQLDLIDEQGHLLLTHSADQLLEGDINTGSLDQMVNTFLPVGPEWVQLIEYLYGMLGSDQKTALERILSFGFSYGSQPYDAMTALNDFFADIRTLMYGTGEEVITNEQLLNAIHAVRDDSTSPHAATVKDVLDKLNDAPLVTLPTTPPAGYGGGSADDVWNAVAPKNWLYDGVAVDGRGNELSAIEAGVAGLVASGLVADSGNLDFLYLALDPSATTGDLGWLSPARNHASVDYIDWHRWTPGQDICTFLNGEQSAYTFNHTDPWGGTDTQRAWCHVSGDEFWWVCRYPQFQLPFVSGHWTWLLMGLVGLPMYPGSASCDFGTPVVLTESGTVSDFMQGVLVSVDSATSNTPFWQTDTAKSYKYAGYLTFASDDGYFEPWQYLGLDKAIYTPKSIRFPSSCTVYLGRATQVTVTPWHTKAVDV